MYVQANFSHIVVGQVGIRCKHCAHNPQARHASAATYYPGSLNVLYQSAQNMAQHHLCCPNPTSSSRCTSIPESLRSALQDLREHKRRASAGKNYWRESALKIGIVEQSSANDGNNIDGHDGLRYDPSQAQLSLLTGSF